MGRECRWMLWASKMALPMAWAVPTMGGFGGDWDRRYDAMSQSNGR